MLKKIRNIAIIVALMSVVALVGYRMGERNAYRIEGDLDLRQMWQVEERLKELFLEKDKLEDKKTLEYGAVKGMVDSLGDPYTVFLPPKENKMSNEDLAGEFGGVGISLGYKDKTLAVMAPLDGTPADRAGVKAGDLILKIIDKNKDINRDTAGISLDEAVALIRGEVGSEVTLKMFREGKSEAFDVNLVRDNIVVPSVALEWQEYEGKKVAWVKMSRFSENLFDEWSQVVSQLKEEKNEAGMVLDLRNNPGGFLQASVVVGSDLLNDGVVVKQESSDGTTEIYKVDETMRRLVNEPMVVLVNGGSASASEILAGALQEHGRAKLVGETTFGKGTVQQPETFKDGSGLHVTIARWLLPSGKNIHGSGVTPDFEVADDLETEADEQLNSALKMLVSGGIN